jgi:hypothetical protein
MSPRRDAVDLFSNFAAERCLLGCLIGLPAEKVLAVGADPDDFRDTTNRAILGAILELAATGTQVDLVTLEDALRRRGHPVAASTLAELYAEGLDSMPGPLVAILKKCTRRRRADWARTRLSAVNDPTADLDAVVAEVVDGLSALAPAVRGDHGQGVVLVSADTIRPEAVSWAWEDRIPLGMVTLLVGIPGQGKSTLTVDIAARASRGDLRGDLFGIPTTVAIATAEDAIPQVVVPRLIAAGADLERVRIIQVNRDGIAGGLSLPGDIAELGRRIIEAGARLVIIDPLVAHIGGSINTWKDQDVRRVLAPLAKLAGDAGAAIVGVMHLNKSQTGDVLNKVGGSVGFGAAARSVLFFAPDPDEVEGYTRILAHAKSNVGPLAPALRFRVEGREVDADGRSIATSGIAWCGAAGSVTAADLVREPGTPAERQARHQSEDAVDEAAQIICELLADGPREAEEMQHELKRLGIPERAWRAAKSRLGVRPQKAGFVGGWRWVLPPAEGGQNPLYPPRPSAFELSRRNIPRRTEEGQCPPSEEPSIFADAKADEEGQNVRLRENPEKTAKADEGGRRRTEYPEPVRLRDERRREREPGEDDVTDADTIAAAVELFGAEVREAA